MCIGKYFGFGGLTLEMKWISFFLQILNAFRGPDGTPVKDLRLKDYSSGENTFPVLLVSR